MYICKIQNRSMEFLSNKRHLLYESILFLSWGKWIKIYTYLSEKVLYQSTTHGRNKSLDRKACVLNGS